MSDQWKYIVLSDGQTEYPIIFHKTLSHVDVSNGIAGESAHSKWSKILTRLKPVAAGFIYFPEMIVGDTTSQSLKLGPRPQDQALFRVAARTQESSK